MNFRVETIGGSLEEWECYVASNPAASNYHRAAWKRIIERSFGHRTYYLAATNGNGRIIGVLPLVYMSSKLFGSFLVSLPFFNYGGVLADSVEAEKVLIDGANKLMVRLGATHVELRHRETTIASLQAKQHKVTMILKLESTADAQWKNFNSKLRNQIRKPEKCGLEPQIGGIELLDGFYEVFTRNMRDLGTPVYGKDFFRNVLNELPRETRIVAVSYEGKTIAAGIATWFRDTMEIPWASSISDYKSMCPNNMLYWEAIKLAIGKGFTRFDFGRSTPDEGTFNFKKQWGAEPVPLYWQYLLQEGRSFPELNLKNPKFNLAIKIWQKLPLAVTNVIGPGIVRNIP